MVSKRVANAKSERHYKSTGPLAKKKQQSMWQVRFISTLVGRGPSSAQPQLTSPILASSHTGHQEEALQPPLGDAVLLGTNDFVRCVGARSCPLPRAIFSYLPPLTHIPLFPTGLATFFMEKPGRSAMF